LKNLDGFDEVVKFADYQPNDEDFDKWDQRAMFARDQDFYQTSRDFLGCNVINEKERLTEESWRSIVLAVAKKEIYNWSYLGSLRGRMGQGFVRNDFDAELQRKRYADY
jgi:hypothetical protein